MNAPDAAPCPNRIDAVIAMKGLCHLSPVTDKDRVISLSVSPALPTAKVCSYNDGVLNTEYGSQRPPRERRQDTA
jgi:hypothetical protein